MWRLLVRGHHLRVTQDTVRLMLRQMDPVGVADRQNHRLRRRTYSSRGPNDTWHVDGYDKLSTYGIHINGYVSIFYATDYNIAVAFTPTCLYNPHNLHS